MEETFACLIGVSGPETLSDTISYREAVEEIKPGSEEGHNGTESPWRRTQQERDGGVVTKGSSQCREVRVEAQSDNLRICKSVTQREAARNHVPHL